MNQPQHTSFTQDRKKSPKRKEKRGFSKKPTRRSTSSLKADQEGEASLVETSPRKAAARRRLRSQTKVEIKGEVRSEKIMTYIKFLCKLSRNASSPCKY